MLGTSTCLAPAHYSRVHHPPPPCPALPAGSFRFEASRTPGSGCVAPSDLEHAFTALMLRTLRRLALEEGLRPDGRGLIDLRELHCEVLPMFETFTTLSVFVSCQSAVQPAGWFCSWPRSRSEKHVAAATPPLPLAQVDTVPVVHGSALFTRGETQSLCTVTVGNPGDEQRTESLLEREGSKRLAVHYAFPAFAINEVCLASPGLEGGGRDNRGEAVMGGHEAMERLFCVGVSDLWVSPSGGR